jgi:hypothetical protein
MGTGYTRNDTPNNIADGNVINASDLDGEFDAVQAAFNGSTGHSHDGTTGEGPQIDTAGIADDAVTSAKLDTNIQIAGTLGVTGETTLTTHLNMGDSDIIKLGASADLQIYHDASNSQIINSVGHLNIDNNGDDKQINLRSDDGSGGITNYIRVNGNTGEVQLYNYGSEKLATTATGIDVTGTATMDGLTVDGDITLNDNSPTIIFDDANGVDQNFTFAVNGGTANIQSRTDAGVNTTRLTVSSNGNVDFKGGDISFYDSTGVAQGFFWDASTQNLGVGVTSPSTTLHVKGGTNENVMIVDATGTAANYIFDVRDDGTSKFRVDPSGNVGIGASSPTELLEVHGDTPRIKLRDTSAYSAGTGPEISFQGNDNTETIKEFGSIRGISRSSNNGELAFYTRLSGSVEERVRIDQNGNVGIGTDSPSSNLHVSGANTGILVDMQNPAGNHGLRVRSGNNEVNDGSELVLDVRSGTSNNPLLNVHAGGNVGIGTSSPSSPLHISLPSSGTDVEGWRVSSGGGGLLYVRVDDASSANPTWEMNVASSEQLSFGIGASEAMRIDDNRNVGIGVVPETDWSSTGTALQIGGMGFICGTDGTGDLGGALMWGSNARQTSGWGGTSNWKYIANEQSAMYQTGDGKHRFFVAGLGTADATITWNEAVNIDNSGNLLVGLTSTTLPGVGNTTQGVSIRGSTGSLSSIIASRATASAGYFNINADGSILSLRKSGTEIGFIGTASSRVYIGSSDTAIRFKYGAGDAVVPVNGSGALRDNQMDMGASAARWDDIYATNGTIQTSDRNEKQDIEELSDAEQRVAVVAKGLMRKFRWRDAVAEKGDNARTHFGIIAQDLQDAFTAEGLDAGDYAMFTSTTWWEKEISVDAVEADEENGIEAKDAYTYMDTKEEATEGYTQKTRLGVRYNQLLAFIISAI